MKLKTCSRCKEMLPPTSFNAKEGQCKPCRNAVKRATEKAQREMRRMEKEFMSNMDGLSTVKYAMANRKPLELAWSNLRDPPSD